MEIFCLYTSDTTNCVEKLRWLCIMKSTFSAAETRVDYFHIYVHNLVKIHIRRKTVVESWT